MNRNQYSQQGKCQVEVVVLRRRKGIAQKRSCNVQQVFDNDSRSSPKNTGEKTEQQNGVTNSQLFLAITAHFGKKRYEETKWAAYHFQFSFSFNFSTKKPCRK